MYITPSLPPFWEEVMDPQMYRSPVSQQHMVLLAVQKATPFDNRFPSSSSSLMIYYNKMIKKEF